MSSRLLRFLVLSLVVVAGLSASASQPSVAMASAPNPSWWSGTCDANNNPGSYALGASYNGVIACGPGPNQGGTDKMIYFYTGAWGEYEWECVELVMRYMYLVYGVAPYSANGDTVVSNYSGSVLAKVSNNGSSLPSPGDIVSESTVHTGVVTAVNVSGGTGTVTIMEQNSSSTGWGTISVSNNVLGSNVTGWLHAPGTGGGSTVRGQVVGTSDFNGDGYPDFVTFNAGTWNVVNGASPHTPIESGVVHGDANSIPMIADFNGDGTPDFVTFNAGTWNVYSGKSPNDPIEQGVVCGNSSSIPMVADFNGDGTPDFIAYNNGYWTIRSGKTGNEWIAQNYGPFGSSTSLPMVADFNGDGVMDFVTFDSGTWNVQSGAGSHPMIEAGVHNGDANSIPMVADFNGDGTPDFITYENGDWYILSGKSGNPWIADPYGLYGNSSTIPMLADFDRDGIKDFVIYQGGLWSIRAGGGSHIDIAQDFAFGSGSDIPMVG